MPRTRALALVMTAGLGLAACGGGSGGQRTQTGGSALTPATSTPTTSGPTTTTVPSSKRHPAASPADTKVVRTWAQTLAKGDVPGASRLFTLPATVQLEPGGPLATLTTRTQVEAFNTVFPCTAKLVRAEQVGPYVDALFTLHGGSCDAPGATARTAFEIRDGRIARWLRLPDEPGENRGDGGGRQGPTPEPAPTQPDGTPLPTF